MSAQTERIEPAPRGWLGYLERSALNLPGAYREALAKRRTRTLILTALLVFGLVYPILNRFFFQGFSRNVFPLPFPEYVPGAKLSIESIGTIAPDPVFPVNPLAASAKKVLVASAP